MPITPHLVISLTDCIGLGRHGIPASNISQCVFVTLHNSVVSSSTTNADHEPARRFFIRIFIFVALAFTDLQNGNTNTGNRPRPTARMSAHLPDLCTRNGVLDLLALRAFVVLFVALNGSGYRSIKNKEALPLDTEVARELSLAWKLAHDLDVHVSQAYTFVSVETSSPSEAQVPSTYSEAADVGTVYQF